MRMSRVTAAALFLSGAMLLTACGEDSDKGEDTTSPTASESVTVSPSGEVTPSGSGEVTAPKSGETDPTASGSDQADNSGDVRDPSVGSGVSSETVPADSVSPSDAQVPVDPSESGVEADPPIEASGSPVPTDPPSGSLGTDVVPPPSEETIPEPSTDSQGNTVLTADLPPEFPEGALTVPLEGTLWKGVPSGTGPDSEEMIVLRLDANGKVTQGDGANGNTAWSANTSGSEAVTWKATGKDTFTFGGAGVNCDGKAFNDHLEMVCTIPKELAAPSGPSSMVMKFFRTELPEVPTPSGSVTAIP